MAVPPYRGSKGRKTVIKLHAEFATEAGWESDPKDMAVIKNQT